MAIYAVTVYCEERRTVWVDAKSEEEAEEAGFELASGTRNVLIKDAETTFESAVKARKPKSFGHWVGGPAGRWSDDKDGDGA